MSLETLITGDTVEHSTWEAVQQRLIDERSVLSTKRSALRHASAYEGPRWFLRIFSLLLFLGVLAGWCAVYFLEFSWLSAMWITGFALLGKTIDILTQAIMDLADIRIREGYKAVEVPTVS